MCFPLVIRLFHVQSCHAFHVGTFLRLVSFGLRKCLYFFRSGADIESNGGGEASEYENGDDTSHVLLLEKFSSLDKSHERVAAPAIKIALIWSVNSYLAPFRGYGIPHAAFFSRLPLREGRASLWNPSSLPSNAFPLQLG
jgi:hypothetical protein